MFVCLFVCFFVCVFVLWLQSAEWRDSRISRLRQQFDRSGCRGLPVAAAAGSGHSSQDQDSPPGHQSELPHKSATPTFPNPHLYSCLIFTPTKNC